MGLGKTVQCITMIAHLIEKGVRGPFLITAPLSTLPNWIAEFRRFTPGVSLIMFVKPYLEKCLLSVKSTIFGLWRMFRTLDTMPTVFYRILRYNLRFELK